MSLLFQVQHYPFYTNLAFARINRPWIYKEFEVSLLQANAQLV